jgi:hypothetical protein
VKRTATLILLLVGIAVPLWLIASGRPGRAKTAAAAESGDEPEESETATAARAAAARRPQVLVVPVPTAGAAQEAPAPAEAAPKTPAQAAVELEEAFRTDKPADASSARMESGIATGFRTDRAKGAALRKVDCHGTRCRLSVDFDDDAADRRVVGNIFELLADSGVDPAQLGFTIPVREVGPDGKVSAVIHLYRVSAND